MCCMLFAINMSAQTPINDLSNPVSKKDQFFETGIKLYSMDLIKADNYFQNDPRNFDHYFLNGLYFKYNKGKSALRVSLNYNQKVIGNNFYRQTGDWGGNGWNYNYGRLRAATIKAGYQRIIAGKKLAAYFFVDIYYSYSQQEEINYFDGAYLANTTGPVNSFAPIFYYPYKTFVERSEIGIAKGLGLRWKISHKIVFNLETNFELYYFKQREKYSKFTQRGTNFSFNPLQFSLGFIF